jgi:hypothetical protein
MSVFRGLGVSLTARAPIVQGYGYVDTLTDIAASWSHTRSANGGYISASCALRGDQTYCNEWIENGLGRWITLYDEAGVYCFHGFVDTVTATIGGYTIKRGPLLGIANRVKLVYSTVDTSTSPSTMGVRAVTATYDDTASQGKFGIVSKVLSSGGTTAANAIQIIRMYLAEHAQPETSKTLSLNASNLGVTLDIKGAWYWLGAYIANFTVANTVNLSTRLTAILALDPNTVIMSSDITANTLQVPGYRNDDKPGLQAITDLLPLGDAAFSRYIAGVQDERVFYYKTIPTMYEYLYRLSAPDQVITTMSGTVIQPWAVQPARWVQVSDAMIGHAEEADLKDDPRSIFIESLTYTAPYDLQINGSKTGTLAQRLAQMGLGGISG